MIVLLAGPGDSTRIVYHALRRAFGEVLLIQEERVSRWRMVRRRIEKLGLLPVIGQLAFLLLLEPLLRMLSRQRCRAILRDNGLDDSPVDSEAIRVTSANSPEGHAALKAAKPDVVVVNGTRILSKQTLGCVASPFVNMHAGITPAFRGVHGGYWALALGRSDLAGTTVHFVDAGIDTGNVIRQAIFHVSGEDSYATYPYLHLAAGIPILIEAVRDVMAGQVQPQRIETHMPSRLFHHPTIGQYVYHRLVCGVG